jgi:hypothetical protein
MGFFDFFKKEEKEIKELNITNLDIGGILDYDLKSWIIEDKTEYDWGNNQFTFEYTINAGDESIYLHVTEGANIKIDISSEIKVSQLGLNFKETIIEKDAPINKIAFEDEHYTLSDEFMGHCKSINDGDDEWSEFVNWVFVNPDETKFISVNRWGETDIDAVKGFYIKEFELSNFLSSPNN